eukprot:3558100-Pleurochrysis_carterae.AAC.1
MQLLFAMCNAWVWPRRSDLGTAEKRQLCMRANRTGACRKRAKQRSGTHARGSVRARPKDTSSIPRKGLEQTTIGAKPMLLPLLLSTSLALMRGIHLTKAHHMVAARALRATRLPPAVPAISMPYVASSVAARA